MEIVVDDLRGPDVAAFLQAHLDQMHELSPPESVHALDLAALRAPEVTFWSVRDAGVLVGCGALKDLGEGHGEVKSMRTDPTRRGQGIAGRLLAHILAEARARRYVRLSLETGSDEFFAPARRLYERHGFVPCAPFADYVDDPLSAYFTLDLTREPAPA
ncbi:GNAT family N-acetyltransferase [Pseudonocardia sp. CA-107938]|uniref:GNAT family N-acetyltransferase n=1 Tax=Pseudonocardia sp. CA-107938 TaxID=3240021 RepID=UPI003D9332FB